MLRFVDDGSRGEILVPWKREEEIEEGGPLAAESPRCSALAPVTLSYYSRSAPRSLNTLQVLSLQYSDL